MHPPRSIRPWLLAAAITALAMPASAQTAGAQKTSDQAAARDGAHDFDFNLGVWHTHIHRLVHPLSGSHDWVELDGTLTDRSIWDGRAHLETIEAKGPSGALEESLTFFTYDPKTRQWSIRFAGRAGGDLSLPLVGEFRDGRGEFVDQETFAGRAILVRGVWSDIAPRTHHFEQAFSADGGRTWEVNFAADLTRLDG